MSVYTVHAPPPRSDDGAPDPERFVFVRDGFHVWAFVFGPVWLLFKRLWLALLIYIVIAALLQLGLWLLAVPRSSHAVLSVLMHLLVALEAATLQRWTLNRRRWTQLGVVTGVNQEAAEQRFFDLWVSRAAKVEAQASPPPAPSTPQPMRTPQPPTDIIGLFPEPQSRQ